MGEKAFGLSRTLHSAVAYGLTTIHSWHSYRSSGWVDGTLTTVRLTFQKQPITCISGAANITARVQGLHHPVKLNRSASTTSEAGKLVPGWLIRSTSSSVSLYRTTQSICGSHLQQQWQRRPLQLFLMPSRLVTR